MNLYEFPLIETKKNNSLQEIVTNVSWKEWFEGISNVNIAPVVENIKHVLSHQIIHTNFYKVTLPHAEDTLSRFLLVNLDDLENILSRDLCMSL